MEKNNVQLSPPQFLLFEKIKSSIGADPTLCIKPIYNDSDIYYIDIITDLECTAVGLSTILIPEYIFGGIIVKVRVFWKCSYCEIKPIKHPRGDSIEVAKELINLSLRCNPYYFDAVIVPDDSAPMLGQISVIFKKKVIQYSSDDMSDFFQYTNAVAQDVFKSIIEDSLFCKEVKLSFSTEILDDQRLFICESCELIEKIIENAEGDLVE